MISDFDQISRNAVENTPRVYMGQPLEAMLKSRKKKVIHLFNDCRHLPEVYYTYSGAAVASTQGINFSGHICRVCLVRHAD